MTAVVARILGAVYVDKTEMDGSKHTCGNDLDSVPYTSSLGIVIIFLWVMSLHGCVHNYYIVFQEIITFIVSCYY